MFLSEGYKDIIAWIYYECEAEIKATVAISSTYNVPDQSFGRYDPKQSLKKNLPVCIKSQQLQRREENPSGLLRILSYLEKASSAS